MPYTPLKRSVQLRRRHMSLKLSLSPYRFDLEIQEIKDFEVQEPYKTSSF